MVLSQDIEEEEEYLCLSATLRYWVLFGDSFAQDIELSSKLDFYGISLVSDYFFEIQYLEKETFFSFSIETFKIF